MNQAGTIAVEPYHPPRRFKAWHVLLVALLILLAAFATLRFILRADVSAAVQEVRDAGYPTTPAELDTWYAEPNGPNLAKIYLEASDLNRDVDSVFAPNAPAAAEQVWYVSAAADDPNLGQPLDPRIVALAEQFLKANAPALAKLHEASRLWDEPSAGARYPADFEGGLDMDLPHVMRVRSLARLLCLEALIAAERGDGDRATAALVAAIGVGRSVQLEPTLVSQLVRVRSHALVTAALEETINRIELHATQVQRLTAALPDPDQHDHFARGLVGELAVFRLAFDDPGVLGADLELGLIYRLYRFSGLADVDHAQYVRTMLELIDAAKTPPPRSLSQTHRITRRFDYLPEYRMLLRLIMPALDRALVLDFGMMAQRRCALLGLHVERYRLDRGMLPADPNDLVPDYVRALPTDPGDGKPLRYIADPNGSFIVYSVGKDGVDNGGRRVNASGDEYGPGSDVVFEVRRAGD